MSESPLPDRQLTDIIALVMGTIGCTGQTVVLGAYKDRDSAIAFVRLCTGTSSNDEVSSAEAVGLVGVHILPVQVK